MNKFFHYVLCFGFLFFSMFSNADTTKNVITPISIEDEIKDKSIDEVLSIVIYRNDVEKMKELLADNIDVNVTDEFGFTPLMIAVQADRVEVVKLLIEAGADINKQDEFGNSMLILAIQRNRENVLDIVNTFLLAGIDVESKTESGLTALMEASFLGQKIW
ncbi:Ribulose-5-phosphate 4-epimerase and related epimerases and aldolases [Phocoenobacter uteri]|uniref:Ribulose-5-phosphate 4-epimerase and related epimerases and aldolases n=1 Tax=Phocoenobacter uteri TaxID=146806 RepID=A0A379CAH3_9PAST|nr:ankyrin repeat domain-containing protein [Phocoenobacter uteri]MDG6881247.1 hypothetical protein [Phocoenobacter uteri]SUB59271.1 Ribulose-5-phosphate 4-epimerase and related epimerases and aldolases [Phocoenobacter uteri]